MSVGMGVVPYMKAYGPALLKLSVVIPARNEQAEIGPTLEAVFRGEPHQVIVADGHSGDDTRQVAEALGATVITAEPGRARQMNAGAADATGDALLFLHADTRLPDGYMNDISQMLSKPGVVAGAFRLSIDAPNRSLRLIERCVSWRSRWLGLPYGDQALFMTSQAFARLGGYADLPVMEDYELVRRLGRLGRIGLADARVVTSARWWLRKGVWCATMLNQACIVGYHLGVSPARLASWRGTRCGSTVARGGLMTPDHEPVSAAGK